MHGGHNGLAAIDDVVDQVAGFAPDAGAHVEVVRHLLHQVQVAAAGKALAFAADPHHPGVGVGVDIAPDIGQFAVHAVGRRGQLARHAALGAHDHVAA
ncbi:hypothetical protein G6F50_017443 [Rhizopus delemar]|uniref:Uncharacterized protein n=1 Tax=Rhizopus delemar TaxID=936053 RepID=A0A9P6XQ47_9FUNG|nr:hypothetical protein G6F50_017443 [Rhizopus delemar]